VFLTYYLTNNYRSNTFLEGILIEVHGMLFDLWIIGVLILFFHEMERRFSENQKYKDEIDDFRYWESEEAKYRIIGDIKRLNRNNVTRIDLSGCYLKKANLVMVNFRGARLLGANLEGANLSGINLSEVNLNGANLEGADLWKTDLSEVSFFRSNLIATNFLKLISREFFSRKPISFCPISRKPISLKLIFKEL